MSYHAPSAPKLEEPQDPLINMGQASQVIAQEKQKSGYLSTFLAAKRSDVKPQGFLSTTLGKTTI